MKCDVCDVADAEVEDDGLLLCQPCKERMDKHSKAHPDLFLKGA